MVGKNLWPKWLGIGLRAIGFEPNYYSFVQCPKSCYLQTVSVLPESLSVGRSEEGVGMFQAPFVGNLLRALAVCEGACFSKQPVCYPDGRVPAQPIGSAEVAQVRPWRLECARKGDLLMSPCRPFGLIGGLLKRFDCPPASGEYRASHRKPHLEQPPTTCGTNSLARTAAYDARAGPQVTRLLTPSGGEFRRIGTMPAQQSQNS